MLTEIIPGRVNISDFAGPGFEPFSGVLVIDASADLKSS
jgi:hypothetical protein